MILNNKQVADFNCFMDGLWPVCNPKDGLGVWQGKRLTEKDEEYVVVTVTAQKSVAGDVIMMTIYDTVGNSYCVHSRLNITVRGIVEVRVECQPESWEFIKSLKLWKME